MINLDRFSKKEEVVLPIVNGLGILNGRKFHFPIKDCWAKISTGDSPKFIEEADELELQKIFEKHKMIKGFSWGNEMVPISFNTARQRDKISANSIPIYFMAISPWQVIQTIRWEDGNLYFVGPDFSYDDGVLKQVKDRFEKEQNLDGIKSVTPEMRWLFFLFEMERQTQKELLKKQKEAEFAQSLGGRLKLAIEQAGGTMIRFNKSGKDNIEVIWSVSGERFNSLIQANSFKAISVGFCVEGEDEQYNIERAVITAKEFEEDGLIHKTRT